MGLNRSVNWNLMPFGVVSLPMMPEISVYTHQYLTLGNENRKEKRLKESQKQSTLAAFAALVCPAELDVLAINAICSSILDELDIGLESSHELELDARSRCV